MGLLCSEAFKPSESMNLPQTIHDIPRQDLLAMLLETVWYSGNRREFDRQGYSLDVQEETAIRDVNYRNAPLFPTAEEAVIDHWRRYFHA